MLYQYCMKSTIPSTSMSIYELYQLLTRSGTIESRRGQSYDSWVIEKTKWLTSPSLRQCGSGSARALPESVSCTEPYYLSIYLHGLDPATDNTGAYGERRERGYKPG